MKAKTYLDPERVFNLAREYVTAVVDGDDERTSAVGFLAETGDALANTVSDPETLIAIAHRLVALADEIAENQAANLERLSNEMRALGPGATLGDLVAHRQRMQLAGVVSLDSKRGRNDPTAS